MSDRVSRLLLVVGSACLAGTASLRAADPELRFDRDIRPILAENCFTCHGPDAGSRKGDLRLDLEAAAKKSAIVPGRPEASELLARIRSTDDDLRMPPPRSGKKLSAKQAELLETWIRQGAPYSGHWAFAPVVRPVPPTVKESHKVRNAIDAFVLARLEKEGLAPSPEADRATLIRRVHLDLIGLPPAPVDVDAFLADDGPDAYERMVDRVLANPHFGERWGRHWLDEARYADSHGYTNDNERSMWPYRDWVVDALNRDLPFDRFTVEQLAGDLLESPTLDQRVATGFHRNTLVNTEGGTKADQFRDEQVKDRIDTTGTVWMGLTVGCAKCHTHKFDPLTQAEYYSLYAFFNSTADANSVTPILKVPTPAQTRRLAELDRTVKELAARIDGDADRRARQARWEAALRAPAAPDGSAARGQTPWTVLELSAKSEAGSTFESLPDKSVLVRGNVSPKEEYKATGLSPLTTIRSVRLEALADERLPKSGPGRAANGNFVLSEFWFLTGDGRELRFAKAAADHSQPMHEVAKAADGKDDTGWAIGSAPDGSPNRDRTAWFVLAEPLEVEEQHALVFTLEFKAPPPGYSVGRFRISISSEEWVDRPSTGELAKLAAVPTEKRSPDVQRRLDKAFLQSDAALRDTDRRLDDARRELDALQRAVPVTMVMEELPKPRPAHVQVRGEFLRTADPVDPDVPACLPPLGTQAPARTRRTFAEWLVRPDHPLTARVRANRIWMHLFGRGLVETDNDFGTQGTLPTHPELLDWLASEFVRREWSTKDLLRTILTSATYRQSSRVRPELAVADPDNLLLARQSRMRVEAEIVRDLALAVSGALSEKFGGPGVYPPQPEGVYAFTQRKKNWKPSTGEDRYRRGLYTFFYRSAPYPMLTTFDVPNFNAACTRRDRSNTPLQSLTLSNSEALVELFAQFGERIREEGGSTDRARLVHAFRLALSRTPTDAETARLERYLAAARRRFPNDADPWTALTRVLVNLDEFVTRE